MNAHSLPHRVEQQIALFLKLFDDRAEVDRLIDKLAILRDFGLVQHLESVTLEQFGTAYPQRLLNPVLLAAQHRFRKLLAGAYRKRNLSIEIFTQTSPERRQKIVAHNVGFGWPKEALA